jgi:NADPH2:quinone reductase
MKAIRFRQPGGPEVLEYVEVPTPTPGPTEVLVKAHSIGVSAPEVKVRAGDYSWMPPLPATPGIEMSGTVVAAGDRVDSPKIGQGVFVSAREFKNRAGCYAEYVVADAKLVYPVPSGVDLEHVAALSNYQLAYHLLYSATRGFQYDSVLVQGAAGGVGSAIVQLAKAAGKRVLGTVSSGERAQFARAQGTDVAINYKTADIVAEIMAGTSGRGVDLILDHIGGPGMKRLIDTLAPFGMLVLYGTLRGLPDPIVLNPRQLPTGKNIALRTFTMHVFDNWPEMRASVTNELIRLLAQGIIKPAIYDRIPLSQASRAHEIFESGKVMGKLIMKP